MKTFYELKKNLKKEFSGYKKIKTAILGDSATQFLTQTLKGLGYESKLNLDIWEADFNQIEHQIFDSSSELYSFKPDIVIVFQSSHKLLNSYNKLRPEEYSSFATNKLESIKQLYFNLVANLDVKVIFYNFSEKDDSVFGNFATKTPTSFLFQLRKLNYELMVFASENANLHICDISSVHNKMGKTAFFQTSIYVNADVVLSINALPEVADKTLAIINALTGKFKKCVIIDLDNTTWGGVIGDDGLENIQIGSLGIGKAFTEFQYWIKKLKQRGIIIAVCSKNTESVAKEPFEKHPEMVLRLEDISVFKANWENKADNIRAIQKILNIGFDSMVFLDDNPFERNIVRENLPEVCVPELPEDPAEYLEYLYDQNIFETVSFSNEDAERTKLYQIEAERNSIQQNFTNVDDFLKSLVMVSLVEPFNTFSTPRVAQLSQRSNQFNLRTIRYSENEIKKISNSENYFDFAFSLKDKFGDHGLIAVVILQKEDEETLFIDTWFMSCRVLKRGMESFTLNTIVNFAKENGYSFVKGEYIPTAKNELIKNHYFDLGFEKKENYWILPVEKYKEQKSLIKLK